MGNPEPERGVFNLRKPRAKKTVVKSYEVYEMAQHTDEKDRIEVEYEHDDDMFLEAYREYMKIKLQEQRHPDDRGGR